MRRKRCSRSRPSFTRSRVEAPDAQQKLRVVPSWPRGEGNAAPLAAIFLAATASFWDGHHHGKTNVKTPRFREQDIPIAITTLIQVLVLQLIDFEVLTVEQAEQVFDGAAKRSCSPKGRCA